MVRYDIVISVTHNQRTRRTVSFLSTSENRLFVDIVIIIIKTDLLIIAKSKINHINIVKKSAHYPTLHDWQT